MRRIKIMGLCLVAVFALTAMAASSASALPEYFECHKVAKVGEGKFSDKKCSLPGEGKTGKYELQPGVGKGKAFKGKGGAATLHTPAIGGEVKCKGFKDVGTITTPTTVTKIVSTFTGCVSLGKPCNSTGGKKGEIKTEALKGGLGYISKSPVEVGTNLSPETGTKLAEFKCENLEILTEGAVIGKVSGGVNEFNKTSTDTFAVTASPAFVQIPTKFETGPKEVLETTVNGSGPFESGQEAKAVNKGEELNLKA